MPQGSDLVLTVAQMQAAEQAVFHAGVSVDELMERAGRGAAEYVWRMAAGRAVTVLCGPGNNGGDGYVIAEALLARGLAVRVIAPMEPKTNAARNARARYQGDISTEGNGISAAVLVDCLFGSGLTRGLSDELCDLLIGLASRHHQCIAVDLPSGVQSDSGAVLSPLPRYDLTLALGAWKWAHYLMPAAQHMGALRLVGIGVDAAAQRDFTTARVLTKPTLSVPPRSAHKYTRGLVAVVAGAMPGAALLAAQAAQHSGAGYVKLLTDEGEVDAPADLVVDRRPLGEALADPRIAVILIGPGLGRDATAASRLEEVLSLGRDVPTVLDADALMLIGPDRWPAPSDRTIVVTPHGGELANMAQVFGSSPNKRPFADKVHQAIELDGQTNATVVAKGPDTVVFQRDLGMVLAPAASSWLSTAGTGDVLAGLIASRLATGRDPVAAAGEALWLHGEAARLAGPVFTASGLAERIAEAYAACL
ncbi:NAD(P)H-hydrate dehydratase [Altererythrobacter sp. H2]|uniref:NAD(P)H-hydrate dehydratase n=1 Tax=Altererythrobacter sp. H2 TaxID=3108391 RepID=UPI002B4BFC48|nr:NAD(P)H-hydrate dehydratase [Altererythrobacter sp. H2]WRK94769.1 NAD(P)H-hydrate dehydratase [Altererythrobacter sp. H2]